MLRIVLKLVLALCLLMQGSFVALAADAVHVHQHSSQHDTGGKMPCCPHRALSDGGSMCGACGVAFIAAPLHVMPRIVPLHVVCGDFVPSVRMLLFGPPTRPPIA